MPIRIVMSVFFAALAFGALTLSGCASDNMKSMDDSMDHHSMEKPMMKDSMDKGDDMNGMKGSM